MDEGSKKEKQKDKMRFSSLYPFPSMDKDDQIFQKSTIIYPFFFLIASTVEQQLQLQIIQVKIRQ